MTERKKYRVTLRSPDGARKVEAVVYATHTDHAIKKARRKTGQPDWTAEVHEEGEIPTGGMPPISLS